MYIKGLSNITKNIDKDGVRVSGDVIGYIDNNLDYYSMYNNVCSRDMLYEGVKTLICESYDPEKDNYVFGFNRFVYNRTDKR